MDVDGERLEIERTPAATLTRLAALGTLSRTV
jgi:hypothetical protein